jgi:hypothetical protein
MIDQLGTLETMVGAQLAKEPSPSQQHIRELITMIRSTPMADQVTDEQAEQLAREFDERHGVTMTIGSVLTEHDYEPWLEGAMPEITPYYWDRYRKLLSEKKFSGQVIATLDEVTERVLGLLENPMVSAPFDRRGLVFGHVQSGKTANYTGLLCKAADAGYKMIVVIAGIHNNLRNQTQERIDEGFVGRDSARLLSNKRNKTVGVGRFDQKRRPATFTNTLRDFNKMTATSVGIGLQSLKEPVVVVIKKNSSTLKNLLEWLSEHSASADENKIDQPMLLIDDEADNASINISHGRNEVSRINGQIRALLNMFQRSCYVGYTATPFANIFIDPDTDNDMLGHDLFPRNFIVSLDPPSNYFGPSRVFLDEETDYIRHIDDNEELLPIKHKIDHEIGGLPESLKTAIRMFVLARAIRLAREQHNEHNSMLVNVSRFTRIQGRIRNEIHLLLDSIVASIRVNGALDEESSMRDPAIQALHDVWELEYSHLELAWGDVRPNLLRAAASTTVVEVNSSSAGKLNYGDNQKSGLNVIAVGGYALSRGLTLEGLSISYVLRNSMMYDTLMQMGRWFGYRPGYEDLCRIWMPVDAEGWYEHISETIDQLRDEIRDMEAANATPEEFGLKIRSHPDSLVITAKNKIGTGELLKVNIGLSKRLIETTTVHNDRDNNASNLNSIKLLSNALESSGKGLAAAERTPFGYLIKRAPVQHVLDFISAFRNHPHSIKTQGDPVRRYIEQREKTEMKEWDILFASISKKRTSLAYDELPVTIYCQERSAGVNSTSTKLLLSNKERLASRGVEKSGLTPGRIKFAESSFVAPAGTGSRRSSGKKINYPDRIYRITRERPLLMIHLVNVKPNAKFSPGIPEDIPVAAWGISFPKTDTEEELTEYLVNTTWLKEMFGDEMDEEEMAGDD